MLLVLLSPSANRVYAGTAAELASAELEILLGAAGAPCRVAPTPVAGVDHLAIEPAGAVDDALLGTIATVVAGASATWAAYEPVGDLLRPVQLVRPDLFDDDLVSIPKYPGKTNEQFTRLLVGLAAALRERRAPLDVLDPLAGRGTTLSTAWTLGHDAYGVEVDEKSVQAYEAFLKTYLRRKRYKHQITASPVRREGKLIGQRLDATVQPSTAGPASAGGATPTGPVADAGTRSLTLFTGDTRDTGRLFGKRRFDAVVADAPYGIVHGSRTDVRGLDRKGSKPRDRTPGALLAEAVPVWVDRLVPGGVLVLSWNTLGLRREAAVELMAANGLQTYDEGPFRRFGHRVDASIVRDVIVAKRP